MLSTPESFALALLAAFFVGVSKTGLPGVGIVLAPIMAMAVPAKDSVGLLVLLLIVGDVFALAYYRRHADIALLRKILPFVFVGIFLGAFLLARLDHNSTRQLIGGIIVGLLILEIGRRKLTSHQFSSHPMLQRVIGVLSGFCTVVGNSAGPLMSIYFILLRMPKAEFMGTAAWFFFIVNVSKVPIYLFIGVLRPESFIAALSLTPLVVVGAVGGFFLLRIISQKLFEALVLGLTAIAALWLLIG